MSEYVKDKDERIEALEKQVKALTEALLLAQRELEKAESIVGYYLRKPSEVEADDR